METDELDGNELGCWGGVCVQQPMETNTETSNPDLETCTSTQ